jgi:hypothetical protein
LICLSFQNVVCGHLWYSFQPKVTIDLIMWSGYNLEVSKQKLTPSGRNLPGHCLASVSVSNSLLERLAIMKAAVLLMCASVWPHWGHRLLCMLILVRSGVVQRILLFVSHGVKGFICSLYEHKAQVYVNIKLSSLENGESALPCHLVEKFWYLLPGMTGQDGFPRPGY